MPAVVRYVPEGVKAAALLVPVALPVPAFH